MARTSEDTTRTSVTVASTWLWNLPALSPTAWSSLTRLCVKAVVTAGWPKKLVSHGLASFGKGPLGLGTDLYLH